MATKDEIIYQQKLVLAAQKDAKAFQALYEEFYEAIYYFIAARVDYESDTDDICSQTFLKAMINLPKYRFKGLPFSAWLYRIAINEVNLFYRATKKSRAIIIDEEAIPEMIVETESSYDQQSIDLLIQSIHHLNPTEVELLELRYFEKRSVREVAMILNMSEANVKVKCHRVIKKLKDYMQRHD